jgi:ABC-type glycerol-3-phosphate transport system substrate-binding protein
MTSEQQTERFAVSALPPWKAIYDKKSVTKSSPALFRAAENEFKDLVLRPPVPSYNKVSHTIQVELQKALLRKKSPRQAMEEANHKANKEL